MTVIQLREAHPLHFYFCESCWWDRMKNRFEKVEAKTRKSQQRVPLNVASAVETTKSPKLRPSTASHRQNQSQEEERQPNLSRPQNLLYALAEEARRLPRR